MADTQRDLDDFLAEHGISQTEVASWFGVESSTISRKLSRARRWTEDEIKTVLARASEKLGRRVTFEEAFGGASTTQALPVERS